MSERRWSAARPWVLGAVFVGAALAYATSQYGTKKGTLYARIARITCGTSKAEVHRLLGAPAGEFHRGQVAGEYWNRGAERVEIEFRDEKVYGAFGNDDTLHGGHWYAIVPPGCIMPTPSKGAFS